MQVQDFIEIPSHLHEIKYLWCSSYLIPRVLQATGNAGGIGLIRALTRKQERFNFRLNLIQKFMECVIEA